MQPTMVPPAALGSTTAGPSKRPSHRSGSALAGRSLVPTIEGAFQRFLDPAAVSDSLPPGQGSAGSSGHSTVARRGLSDRRRGEDPPLTPLIRPGVAMPLAASGLLDREDESSIVQALLSSNAPSGRRSIWSKFGKYWSFCSEAKRRWSPIPTEQPMVWAYVQFLRDSTRIHVQSVPQYISVVATVHRWLAFPSLRLHDSVVDQLLKSWRLKVSLTLSKE